VFLFYVIKIAKIAFDKIEIFFCRKNIPYTKVLTKNNAIKTNAWLYVTVLLKRLYSKNKTIADVEILVSFYLK